MVSCSNGDITVKYTRTVEGMFGENWMIDDKEGAYGVMIMLAFLQDGVKLKLDDMSKFLGIQMSELESPFTRLAHSGYFSRAFDAFNDKALLFKATPTEVKCAWGYVAGIASGFTERNLGSMPSISRRFSQN